MMHLMTGMIAGYICHIRTYRWACLPIGFAAFLMFAVPARAELTPNPFPIGPELMYTTSISWGDLDNDGDLDLAVAYVQWDAGDSTIQIYQNDQDQLLLGQKIETDKLVASIAWGEWDNDGDLDLAVGNGASYESDVATKEANQIYRNDGGTLNLAWESSGNLKETASVAWGDVDNDGDLDLAVGNSGANDQIYRNDGSSFTIIELVSSGETNATKSVAWGDWDTDGDLDLAVAGEVNRVYDNEGGVLGLIWEEIAPGFTAGVAWGDWDWDGDLDLAAGKEVYENIGQDLVRLPREVDYTVDTYSVAWGDWDNDGNLDLAQGNGANYRSIGAVNQIYENKNYTLTLAWESSDQRDTLAVAWADWDNDGDLDLTAGNGLKKIGWAGPTFSEPPELSVIYENEGSGYLGQVWQSVEDPRSDAWMDKSPTSVAWGDWDNDGDLDLAVGNGGTLELGYDDQLNEVFENNNCQFGDEPVWESTGNERSTQSVAWGDWDNDGDLDLAVGNRDAANQVFRNDGGTLTLAWEAGGNPKFTTSVAWGDWDNDGDLDLAVGNEGERLNGVYAESAANQLYRNEGGTFTLAWESTGDERSTTSVAWGDWDNDGDLDLAVGNRGEDGEGEANQVYDNDGGTLTLAWESTVAKITESVAWGDWDNDGDLDLAVGNFGDVNQVYRNDGKRLTLAWSSDQVKATETVMWGDWDNDGDLDLFVGTTHLNSDAEGEPNQVFENTGGNLVLAWEDSWNFSTIGSAWGDCDNDGDLDLAIADTFPGNFEPAGQGIFIYENGKSYQGQVNNPPHARIERPGNTPDAYFYSMAAPLEATLLPITYRLFDHDGHNVPRVTGYYSLNGGGKWLPAIPTDDTQLTNLSASQQGEQHTFVWNTFASGLFGQSDQVLFRLDMEGRNGIGPFMFGRTSAISPPFSVRGTQVRVLDESGLPAQDAQVYLLPSGQTGGATPIASDDGTPFETNSQGYLQGRGALEGHDQLVALVPVTATHAFTLYTMSAAPTAEGLEFFSIAEPGVQELHASAQNPLLLFNIDISLEWDARNDGTFMDDLKAAVQRSSAILFDVTNGQAALGDVRIHQAKQNWLDAHVVLFAANNIHPRASMGGIVALPVDDVGVHGQLPNAYLPGQVRIGPAWDPFGQSQAELSEDWWQALAHELAHYLLFLPDNYLGIDQGLLKLVDCRNSFMTNAYDDEYSELLTRDHWDEQPSCQQTIAQYLTGRSDWETVTHFLPWFHAPSSWATVNVGPASLPLAVTRIINVDAEGAPSNVLPAQNFDLRDEVTGELTTVAQAQAYLFQSNGTGNFDDDITDDQVIALGTTGSGSDRIKVRGAALDDRVCVIDTVGGRVGCARLTDRTQSVSLQRAPEWHPDITVTPVNSTTLAITVAQELQSGQLNVQVLPAYSAPESSAPPTAPWSAMQQVQPGIWQQEITLAAPTFEGFVRVWVPESNTRREAVTQFFLSTGWGPNQRGSANDRNVWGPNQRGSANTRAWGANYRSMEAPIASGDGRVTIFNLTDLLADNGAIALQALSTLPNLPFWLTPVAQGYRFVATESYSRTIAFHYLQREVPAGYEQNLSLYYSPDEGQTWQRLPTTLNIAENLAAALMPQNLEGGQGIYALLVTVEMPPLDPGWNLFTFPIPQQRIVWKALESISGFYTSVYSYDEGQTPPWQLYDATVAAQHANYAQLVNKLTQLEFGQSYWLYTTQVITPYLGVPDLSISYANGQVAAQDAAALDLPPATFYGPVAARGGFKPKAGMAVTAWLGRVACGESTVQTLQQELAYVIQVVSNKEVSGCGVEGALVTIQVGGQTIASVTWSNHEATYLALPSAAGDIFMPAISK